MIDKPKGDKETIRSLLAMLQEARLREPEGEAPSDEVRARARARFETMLRERSGGAWSPDAGVGAQRVTNVVSLLPGDDPKVARPQHLKAPDYEERVLLAAGEEGEEPRWKPTRFRLAISERLAVVFQSPDTNSSLSVQTKDLAPEWRGIVLGKHKFRFMRSSTDPDWALIDGLSLRTLRAAATGETDELEHEIKAQPLA